MKTFLSNSLLILVLAFTHIADATLYKGKDADGNVIYSDRPFEASKKFTPPPISVTGPEAKEPEAVVEEKKPKEFRYLSFDITSPKDNQPIRYDADVTVSLKITPGINTEKNHSITLTVDGSPRVENTQSLTHPLGLLSVGGHRIQAQIKDSEGKIVARTRTTTVLIYQKALP